MPARISSAGLRTLRTRGDAYSLRYTAVMSPIGSANDAAIAMTNSVPLTKGQMPKCFSLPSNGFHSKLPKNSPSVTSGNAKKPSVSLVRMTMIVAVTKIEKVAASASIATMSRSRSVRAATDFCRPNEDKSRVVDSRERGREVVGKRVTDTRWAKYLIYPQSRTSGRACMSRHR